MSHSDPIDESASLPALPKKGVEKRESESVEDEDSSDSLDDGHKEGKDSEEEAPDFSFDEDDISQSEVSEASEMHKILRKKSSVLLPEYKAVEAVQQVGNEKPAPHHNWFYTGYLRLARIGRKINHNDLYNLPQEARCEVIGSNFINVWEEEFARENPSLWAAVFKTFWKSIVYIATLQICSIMLQFAIPILLPFMTEFMTDLTIEYYWGYIYSSIALVATVLSSIFWYKSIWQGNVLGIKIRTVFMAALYKKVVTSNVTNGAMFINLFAQDASMMFFYMPFIVPALITPVTLIITLGILGWKIQLYTFITLGIILIVAPMLIVSGQYQGMAIYLMQKFTDKRLKHENELVQGIRVIKYYVWEEAILKKIDEAREEELGKIRSFGYFRTFTTIIPNITPTICLAVTFIVYGLTGPILTPDVAYTIYSLMNLVRLPLAFLAAAGILVSALTSSVTRIQMALVSKPKESYLKENDEIGLKIENANFKWDSDEKTTLKNINLEIKEGERFVVVGPVGNGKSSIAMAVLGEIPKVEGEVKRKGSIAYVPQLAWIINATARENILFGNDFDAKWYAKVVHAAGLAPDFKQFTNGDLTEIGARGVNLSGGQKQRISIARALYSRRDIYVFDDPFSALDSHVSKHVFDNAICGLLKKKTVFLTTNQLMFARDCTRVILMNNGQVEAQGSYEELKKSSKTFKKLIKIYGGSDKKQVEEEPPKPAPKPVEEEVAMEEESGLVEIEEKQQGLLPVKIYRYYIKAGGTFLFLSILSLLAIVATLRVLGSWWLTRWMADLAIGLSNTTTVLADNSTVLIESEHGIHYWVWTYFAWLLSESIVFGIATILAYVVFSVKAGRTVHNDLIQSLANSVVAFFDKTPIGRIIQRLSTDMGMIDTFLPIIGINWLNSCFVIISAIASLGFGGWYVLPVWAFVFVIFYFLQDKYRKINIEIQRMEAISSAPPISTMVSTIEGLVSIRAYDVMDNFTDLMYNFINYNNIDKYNLRLGYSWYGVSLEITTGVLVGIVFYGLSIARNYFYIDPSFAALSLSSLAGVTTQFAQVFINFTEVEVRMNSVERFVQFKKIQREKTTSEVQVDDNWPNDGNIKFENFCFKYRKGPVVLKNLNVDIKPRSKIGIVGRTGSGKSSILQALFRMEEPHSGCIIIDGVDTSKMPLSDLRRKLSIIPQDPVLFVGNLRYNLDPFSEKTDKEIWDALELVQLKEYISGLEGGLSSPVEEDGKNFSVGQRQLLCMARALLKNSPILLLDEATASVDVETDQLIQKTVRKAFKHCTVLTIAHRINTIMDSDKVLVLDAGKVLEYDSPKNLLKNKDSVFTGLAKAAGAISEKK